MLPGGRDYDDYIANLKRMAVDGEPVGVRRRASVFLRLTWSKLRRTHSNALFKRASYLTAILVPMLASVWIPVNRTYELDTPLPFFLVLAFAAAL